MLLIYTGMDCVHDVKTYTWNIRCSMLDGEERVEKEKLNEMQLKLSIRSQ